MSEIQDCPVCDGEGERETGESCSACEGRGKVEVSPVDGMTEEEESEKTPIPTIDPEMEPELVGFHSGINADRCQNFRSPTGMREDVEKCGNEATHTMVLYSGRYHKMSVCDECGDPEQVADDRKWSGRRTQYAE